MYNAFLWRLLWSPRVVQGGPSEALYDVLTGVDIGGEGVLFAIGVRGDPVIGRSFGRHAGRGPIFILARDGGF